ncbi:MAG: hypothetical protein HY535_05585 [Chloroflexi bacterium]|nr:hypothetical protein [Chloroflexota bacterium]
MPHANTPPGPGASPASERPVSERLARLLAAMEPQEYEGPSKVCTLEEAIATHVKPGHHVFLSQRAYAGLFALLRRFWGSRPNFTLSSIMTSELMLLLVYGGLVRKLVTSSVWGPVGRGTRYQQAVRQGGLQAEMWTIHTIILRLMAGGSGVPFLPTRSIIGSSLAQELPGDAYAEVPNPFGSPDPVALVAALRPDVAIIHGLVADPAGNTVLVPDWSVDAWGARACRGSVIVHVDKIVSTQAIRRHAPLVKVPGHMVSAVCPAPFGGFPGTVYNGWVGEVPSYLGDREFSRSCVRAVRGRQEEFDAWVQEWVQGPATHEAFLEHLGRQRLGQLQAEAEAQLQHGLAPVPSPTSEGYDDREMMTVATARKIAEVVRRNGYRFIQTGPGLSAPATYLAYYLLREQGYDVEVMSGFGNFAYLPQGYAISSIQHLATPKLLGDMFEMYSAFLRGPDSPSLAVLGIVEIDKSGNINTSRLDDGTLMGGSGGHNDCAMGAGEVLIFAPMEPRRFRDRLGFVTTPGDRVRTVVTDLGILEKVRGQAELVLTSYYSTAGASAEEAVATIRGRCGWDLQVAADLRREPPPAMEELVILRRLDPERRALE